MKRHIRQSRWLVAVFCVLAVAAFAGLYWVHGVNRVEKPNEPLTSTLDDWNVEQSAINGAPLAENKNIYKSEDPGELTTVYITVFPTYDEAGNLLDFSAFDQLTSRDKTFSPVLDANVQFGDADGSLNPLVNTNSANSTIQVRGNSARGAKYKSYKVKLKDENSFQGQTVLNINKHMFDVSKIANKFCMDMMQQVDDMASFSTYFMRVYIKDASLPKEQQTYKYYGLYTDIEQPNKTYLRRRGLDENGTMYKASNFEFRLTPELKNVDDPGYDEEAFETVLGIREAKDHTKLLQMLTDINDVNQDFNTVFHKYFNEDNYLTWLACNVLLGNEDTIAHNFILYSPQDSLTWYLLPWDYDGTFKFGEYASSFQAPQSLKGVQRLSGVQLHRRYLLQPGNQEKLTAKIQELMRTSFTEERVNSLLDSYRPVLEEMLDKSPDLELLEIPLNQYNRYINQFYGQIEKNYQAYLNSVQYPLPFFVSEPQKNSDGTTHFAWEPSYSAAGRFVTYSVTLAKDPGMQNVVLSKENLTENQFDSPGAIAPGDYYLAVTSTDDAGVRQISLDYYQAEKPVTKAEIAQFKRNGNSSYYYGVRKIHLE